MRWVGTMELGTTETEADLLRKAYKEFGEGKLYLRKMGDPVVPIWTGWIQEVQDELHIKLRVDKETGEFKNYVDENTGLEPLDYSRKGEINIKKKGEKK